jgi:hypothetical protein
MGEINCYFPITLRITGRPSDAQLDQLGDALARALAARISLADRTIAAHSGESMEGAFELLREGYDPTRVDDASGTYSTPAYDRQGSLVSMRLSIGAGGRPWYIRTAIDFHARVGAFLDFVDDLDPKRPLPGKILYIDQYSELRWVSLWLVQVNQDFTLGDLELLLSERAEQLSRMRSDQLLAYGLGTTDTIRQQLIELDEDGIMAPKIPSLRPRNALRVVGKGPDSIVKSLGWVLFASMLLPKIELVDVATQLTEVKVGVQLRDLAFLIPDVDFEKEFHISWREYAHELGSEPATLRLQPVMVEKRIHVLALNYLVAVMINEQLDSSPESSFTRYGRLFVLNQSELDKFPAAARSIVEAMTNDVTRKLDNLMTGGELEPDWKTVFAFATLDVNTETIGMARYRPIARQLTPLLLAKLQGDSSDSSWKFRLLGFMRSEFGSRPPETRPDGGIPFEYVLEELERIKSFELLFDKVESSGFFPLKHLLLLLSLATVYAGHERVRRLHRGLTEHMLKDLQNTYLLSEGAIQLEHDPRRTLRIKGVLGEVDSIYLFEKEEQRLKPSRLPAFKEALEIESKAIIERILKGEETRQFNEEEFSREAIGKAALRIKLSEEDFEEITIQRSLRLVKIESRIEDALPMHYVTFEFVERVEGEAWRAVSRQITESDDDFTARLIYWHLAKAGEVYEKIGMAIMIVGLIAIAWQAGIIAALVSAAGGTTTVLISIGISELIFILRVIFGDAKLTLRGFLEAALDGYLMALGFRGAGLLGRATARAIGRESLKHIVGGWIAERLIVGTVGGAGTAALTTFSHDLINIATGRGGWSSIGEYVNKMAWGALLGTVFEFGVGALQPILRAGGENALQTLSQVVERVRGEGFTNVKWTVLTAEALGKMRDRLNLVLGDVATQGFVRAIAERLTQVTEQLGGLYRLAVFRRVLELSPSAMSRPAVDGLEKFLNTSRADLTDEAALALLNRLNSDQLRVFLESLNTLDASILSVLAKSGHFETLAAAPQLAGIIRNDSAISALIRQAAGAPGGGAARVRSILGVAGRLPNLPESIERGTVIFSRDGKPVIFEVAGRPDLLTKIGGGRSPVEAQAMIELEMMGIETVYAGTRQVKGQTNILLKNIDGVGSKDMIGRLGTPLRPPRHAEIVTQRTIDDLERIYKTLQDNKANIGDFQFIVRRSDGAVFMNDPVGFTPGSAPSGKIRNIIDTYRKILRDKTSGT